MSKLSKMLIFLMLASLMLLGCSSEVKSEDKNTNNNSVTTANQTQAPQKTLILPTIENKTGKVLIQTVSQSISYPYNSYIITSSKGESIVVDPTNMPSTKIIDINPAAIISTHSHPDHIDNAFTNAYKCPNILYVKSSVDTKDFKIYTIPSAHKEDVISDPPNNIMAVFEVDGMRIAHLGDVGQNSFTDDQLKQLGKIDIAFAQFENSYSSMTLENQKGFKLIEQLKPTIVIPTHYTDKALPIIEEKYGKIQAFENILSISKDDLPKDTLKFYRILNKHVYQ